jgi:hypothetical protein
MQPAKFSGLFDTIVQAVTTVLPFVTSGSAKQPAFSTINATDSVSIQLNQLEVAFAALPSNQRLNSATTALQTAQQLRSAYDSIPTKDARDIQYLQNAKTIADKVVAHIQQMIQEAQAGNTTPTGATTTTPTGTTQTVPVTTADGKIIYIPVTSNSTDGGLDENSKQILLYGGIGLVALLLLKK